ncbi:MAG TPA: hypothetical protein VK760_11270 [Candidatus Acidoferrales bacterium]|nr:hypothetical protein [Candidatus Acidoferrales bacterium]
MPTQPNTGMPVTTQRLEAQTAIAVAQGIHAASLLTAALADIQNVLSGKVPPPDGTCKDGVEKTVKIITPTSIKATVDVFYDAACTQKLSQSVLTAILTIGTDPLYTVAIDGTATIYNSRGRHVGFGTISNTTTVSSKGVTQSTSTGTISSKPNGKGTAMSFGLSCTYSTTNTCGFGGVVPVSASQELGVSAVLTGFTGSGKSSGTVSLSGYAGSAGGLTLAQGTGDDWTISGGTKVVAQKGTFSEKVNGKTLNVDGTLAVQDSANNAAVTLSFGTRVGIKNGRVKSIAPSKLFSTFSTDETGTGAIAYSEGPAGRILFFIIQS